LMVVGAAAGLVAVVSLRGGKRDPHDAAAPATVEYPLATAAEWFLPPAVWAEGREPARAPRAPLAGGRIREGTWTYVVRTSITVSEPPLHATEVAIRRGRLDGQPAWILVQRLLRAPDSLPVARADGVTPPESLPPEAWQWRKTANLPRQLHAQADTVWLSADSLRPLARVSAHEGFRREERYLDEYAQVSITTGGFTENRSIARSPLYPARYAGFLLRQDVLLAQLFGLPLARGFRGSIDMIALGGNETYLITPLELAVVGEERVTVPAGSFDCWKLEVGAVPGVLTIWVAKDGQWLVRQTTGARIRGGFERVLAEMRLD
jgi:hypothetical protein